jgi:integrase
VWQDNNLVFPNTVGKPMNAGNFYRSEFQPLLERASLAHQGFTFHSLRHTFATTLAAKGVHPSTAPFHAKSMAVTGMTPILRRLMRNSGWPRPGGARNDAHHIEPFACMMQLTL